MSRTKNAIVNTIFGSLQKVLQMLLPFVMRSIMLHTLGIGYLGLNGLFTSVLQTLSIAELGIAGAITYNMYLPIARKDTDQVGRLLRLYRILYAVIGLTILLLGAALLPFLPKLISGEVPEDINIYVLYLMYLVSTAMSYSLFSYRSSLLEAHQQNNIISKVNIVTTLIQFILQVICLLLFRNYYLYIMLQFAMQLVNQIIVYFCSRRLYPEIRPVGKLDKQTISNIFRNVKGLVSGRIAGIILHSSDTIVISMFLGLAVLVVYQNYFFILTAITGIISTSRSSRAVFIFARSSAPALLITLRSRGSSTPSSRARHSRTTSFSSCFWYRCPSCACFHSSRYSPWIPNSSASSLRHRLAP